MEGPAGQALADSTSILSGLDLGKKGNDDHKTGNTNSGGAGCRCCIQNKALAVRKIFIFVAGVVSGL